MNELKTITHDAFGEIRTLEINGEPWFVAKDVTNVLGYTNASKAISDHVDEDEKVNNETLSSLGQRGGVLINESGLYSLIMGSKLPSAKQFKKWITSEVLPSIRKHGAYMTEHTIESLINNPDMIIELATTLKEERNKRLVLEQQVKEFEPKVSYYDLVLASKGTVTTSVIAKDYGMSAINLNKLLHELKIQYKQGGIWLLYSKHQSNGYTKTKTFVDNTGVSRVSTRWTQQGRLFLYEQLKSVDVLPVVEQ